MEFSEFIEYTRNILKAQERLDEVPAHINDAVQQITRKLAYITELQWIAVVRENKRYRIAEVEQLIAHLTGARCVTSIAIEQLEDVLAQVKKEGGDEELKGK